MIPLTHDRQLELLHAGLRAYVPLNLLAHRVGRSAKECDLILWRGLGLRSGVRSAVRSIRIEHDPRRQTFGHEPAPNPPRHADHLAALGGSFPVAGKGIEA